MSRMIALMKFDTKNALRDSLVLYVVIAPILLAIGLRVFLPSVEGSVATIAVAVPSGNPAAVAFADRLEAYGRVERYESAAEVEERVLGTDDAGGFVPAAGDTGGEGGAWRIVLEGNEPAASVEVMQAVGVAASSDTLVGEYTVTEEGTRSPFREYASVALIMLCSLIGGVAVAFTMIEEKEQNVTRAFTVTPLSPFGYFAARGILAAFMGTAIGTVGHLVLVGTTVPFARFALAIVAAAPLPLLVALLVGGIAKNQIQAVAALKVVMLVYLTIPFVSIAVPRSWHWVFYPFPNYWMFRSFEDIYVTGARIGDLPLAAAVTAVGGLVVLVALGMSMRKQLKPRYAA
ncbi:MAG: ABC transporter permease [Spirochaetota bacterium]